MERDWVGIAEAANYIGREGAFVRTLKQQGLIACDPERPEGYVSLSSLLDYLDTQAEKEPAPDRLSNRACRMIRSRVERDTGLPPEMQKVFLTRLDVYEAEWDAEAEKRQRRGED
jgi:hypothetical protein